MTSNQVSSNECSAVFLLGLVVDFVGDFYFHTVFLGSVRKAKNVGSFHSENIMLFGLKTFLQLTENCYLPALIYRALIVADIKFCTLYASQVVM